MAMTRVMAMGTSTVMAMAITLAAAVAKAMAKGYVNGVVDDGYINNDCFEVSSGGNNSSRAIYLATE